MTMLPNNSAGVCVYYYYICTRLLMSIVCIYSSGVLIPSGRSGDEVSNFIY